MSKEKEKVSFEFSAGGLVFDEAARKLALVRVKNLQGEIVWTFPKGHIEKGETAPEAALREVREETGWACEIRRPFEKVQYWFRREGGLVKKSVTWFLMAPVKREGAHDADEILEIRWADLAEARELVSYRSDITLLEKFSAEASP